MAKSRPTDVKKARKRTQPLKRRPQQLSRIQECELRIRSVVNTQKLWERLTADDRECLGGTLEAAFAKYPNPAQMWARLRGVSVPRAVLDVNRKLGLISEQTHRSLLREIGELADDPEEAIKQAVSRDHLVLVERPRTVYWHRNTIPIDWDKREKLWIFIWELCRQAKAGQPIDRFSFGKTAGPDYVIKQKSRLAGLPAFPRSLANLIKRSGLGTKKLDVARERIHLFEVGAGETLRERTE
jgi:hypothetical protein